MKVGILTFHKAHNYGAVLQCYGLQETLKGLGHDVKVLDYCPEDLRNRYKIIQFKSFRDLLVLLTTIVRKTIRYVRFKRFMSERLDIAPLSETGIDLYVIGSDQVWNKKLTNGYRDVCFGNFGTYAKVISYGASAETSYLGRLDKAYFEYRLRNFDKISVREKHLVKLLQPLTDQKIYHVLDPTLLAGRGLFDNISVKPKIKDKYVLVYQVRADKKVLKIAKDIAQQTGARVIQLSSRVSPRYIKGKHQCASPEQFIGWIENASCVVTTSYHGVCFSVMFKRPFYAVKLGDNETRIESLLDILCIKDRFIQNNIEFKDIDYVKVNQKLRRLRSTSFEYLNFV